jgi:hypothetical protein
MLHAILNENSQQKIITIILMVVVLTFIRETGVLNMNYYKMTSSTTSRNNWTDKSVIITIDSSLMGSKFVNRQFSDLPVIVLYGSDTLYSDRILLNPIIVTIDSLQNGFLWTPLYKSTTFKVVGISKFTKDIIKTPPARISLVKANHIGHLSIKGGVSITGLCSHRHALELIKELAVKDFVLQTRQHFSRLD